MIAITTRAKYAYLPQQSKPCRVHCVVVLPCDPNGASTIDERLWSTREMHGETLFASWGYQSEDGRERKVTRDFATWEQAQAWVRDVAEGTVKTLLDVIKTNEEMAATMPPPSERTVVVAA